MKQRIIVSVVMLMVVGLAGCRTFSGNISFKNQGSRLVWVDDVQGFKRTPPCGILSPAAYAGARMDRMRLPEEVVLLWSYDLDKADNRSVVVLRDISPPSSDAELQFVFTTDRTWIVRWRDRNDPL